MVITGGERGIGAAIARGMADEGGIPVIIGRREQEALQVVESIRQKGGEADFIKVELTDEQACQQAVWEILSKRGRIDCLVNNAGVNDRIGLENGNPTTFLHSIKINLLIYYTFTHYALDALKANKGSIVNISSKTALTGQGSNSGYVAAKAGQLGLTRDWAIELLPYGMRVNAVLPAEVWTELYEEWISTFDNPEEKLEAINKLIPFGNRMTRQGEIADTVLFLASDRASHITGQFIHVDGGYVHLDRALGT